MPKLRLGKLPNRTRTRLILDIGPELDDQLKLYASLHSQEHDEEVSAADIAPYILAEFLKSDRELAKALAAGVAQKR